MSGPYFFPEQLLSSHPPLLSTQSLGTSWYCPENNHAQVLQKNQNGPTSTQSSNCSSWLTKSLSRTGPTKMKQARTEFTSEQISELENAFSLSHVLDRSRRIWLAKSLRLNQCKIMTWFRNRRLQQKEDQALGSWLQDEDTVAPPPPQDYPSFINDLLSENDTKHSKHSPRSSTPLPTQSEYETYQKYVDVGNSLCNSDSWY